jgi:hypothetical protein
VAYSLTDGFRIVESSDVGATAQTESAADADEASRAGTDSGPKNPAEFIAFWESTQGRINDYHQDATSQLRSSYLLAQTASVGGFIVLLGLGVTAAIADTTTQSVAAAAVATVGAALAAYTGRTFNRNYAKALARSTTFFHEPVVMARLLAAERLLAEYGDRDDERAKALTAMVQAAVSFDPVPTAEFAKD